MKQTIVFTALPHNIVGGIPRVSIFVAPRLETGAGQFPLEKFQSFVNWPETLKNIDFGILFNGSGTEHPTKLSAVNSDPDAGPVVSSPDPAIWANLFKKNTPVGSFVPRDYADRGIYSYPVYNILSSLKGLYRSVAEEFAASLPIYKEGKDNGASTALTGFINTVGSITQGRFSDVTAVPVKKTGATDFLSTIYTSKTPDQRRVADFAAANRFMVRPGHRDKAGDPNFAPVPMKQMEFHEIISAFGGYPTLLQQLGLVVEVDLPDVDAATLNKYTTIRVVPHWKSGKPAYDAAPQQPDVKYETNGDYFGAMPRKGSDIQMGMLRINAAHDNYPLAAENSPPPFALMQVDPDGAAAKASDFASNFQRMKGQPKAYTTDERTGLPALRSSGIGLIRINRGYELFKLMQQTKSNLGTFASGAGTTMYAEDVLRGYRVDIQMSNGTWYSLNERTGYYHFTNPNPEYKGNNPLQITDSGFVRSASASSDIAQSPDLYFHESMFRWEGWSLAAPRPGKSISYDPAATPHEQPSDSNNSATGVPHVYMEVNFKAVPRTLPVLRFGHTYRLRARAVDMAGNSHTLKSAPAVTQLMSNELNYKRFEPVSQPFVVLRAPVTEGESPEHLVIRSNYDKKAADYVESVKTEFNLDYDTHTDRHLAPPKTSQLMAETHSMFDSLLGGDDTSIKKAFMIATKEEGTFLDTQVLNTETGNLEPVKGIRLITPPSSPAPHKYLDGSVASPGDVLLKRGDPLATGQYVIHTSGGDSSNPLKIPYLPDPFAAGAALAGLPGVDSNADLGGIQSKKLAPYHPMDNELHMLHVPFDGTWPEIQPFLIRVVELPGETAPTDCSSIAKPAYKPPTWDSTNRILTAFLPKGEVRQINYSCYLPKKSPTNPAQSALEQMGIMKWLDGSSRLSDFRARAEEGAVWTITPWRTLTLTHAVQQPLCPPLIGLPTPSKYKSNTYVTFVKGFVQVSNKSTGRLDMMGRWTEWIDAITEPAPQEVPHSAHVCDWKVDPSAGDGFSFPGGGISFDEARHEFHDTRHRWVDYSLIGTTRFPEFFPDVIGKDSTKITREGPPHTHVNILNSARPDIPKLLYIVPTFGWEQPDIGTGDIVSKRCGGGLRVYLDRPWYSSGDDELLGVVLSAANANLDYDSPLHPYVTQWGMDPIWSSWPTYQYPQTGHFKDFVGSPGLGLSLDELPAGPAMNVVGYKPEYDAERQLWYCDIEVDAGPAYFPFIRLALARYQPYSVGDCHLSRIVQADFAQLTADRVASITFVNDKALAIVVSGSFAINAATAETSDPLHNMRYSREVVATLESQDFPSDEELSWHMVSSSEVHLEPLYKPEFGFKLLWMSRMLLPDVPKRFPGGTKIYRIVVKEYEYLPADDMPGAIRIDGKPFQRRLVYADAIKL